MRQIRLMSRWIAAVLIVSTIGCQSFTERPFSFSWPSMEMPDWSSLSWQSLSLRSQSPESDEDGESEYDDEFETSIDVPVVGDHTTIAGLNLINLQGVGLVTGLPGTGSDPPPSRFRTRLVEDMRRRGVRNPNTILRSKTTALVVIQAYLPPLVRKGDRFDIEVRVPGADETTSLNGGWLMETLLSEQAIVPGQGPMEGHVYAKAGGPILISAGDVGSDSRAALLRRGRVLGGGISLKDRDLALFLRNDFRSVRNSKRIAECIGTRFSDYNEAGIKQPLAEAKTDQRVELKVPLRYRNNYPRYLQVVRNIAFRESEVAQRVRMQKLKKELNRPPTSERAALELEAIGVRAIPVLRSGLKNRSPEVRFHSAMALTYLDEPDGLQTLIDAARDEPAFRVFALAALASSDEPEVSLMLRELLNEQSAETRYGAWRALTTIAGRDPITRDENISDEFKFHVLNTSGPPMIHLTNRKKAEIVLFGDEQRFLTPLALRAGNDILVTAAEDSDTVVVSRYEVGEPDRRREVSTRVADVIRAVAEFEATYPDIAQMLAQAQQQHNVPGSIELDAVPQAGRVYYRNSELLVEREPSSTHVGNPGQSPNIFSHRDGGDKSFRSDQFGGLDLDAGSGTASAVDIRDDEEDKTDADEEDDEQETDDGESRKTMSPPGKAAGKPRKWYDLTRFWKWPGAEDEDGKQFTDDGPTRIAKSSRSGAESAAAGDEEPLAGNDEPKESDTTADAADDAKQ